MAWVTRGRRRYYYRPVREGRAVRQVFYGDGPLAELAAQADGLKRAGRLARARAWHDEEARRVAADLPSRRLDELAGLLTRAALVAAGYRQHDRGAWRKSNAARG